MLGDFEEAMRALSALQSKMDDAFSTDWFAGRTASRGANPPINVFEKGHDIVVLAEVPGMEKGDFSIQVERNVLRIAGKRSTSRTPGTSAHRLERKPFEFDRALTLPFDIAVDGIKAEYRDGILAILLPRAEAHRPQNISVD